MAEDITNSGSFCGIGTTPIPNNDPDLNNSSISAFPVRFGIQVHWSYPNKNPEMVAFTEIFKSNDPNLGGTRIAVVSGDNYTDILDEDKKGIKYYYRIRHKSIHGTMGDYIGPASATWHGSIDDILEWLQGLITNSQLDQDLRDRINDISDISTGLRDEIADREGLGLTLNQLIAEVKQNLEDTDALVGSAVTEIVNDNHALAASVNIVMAQWNNSFAGVQDEVFAVANDTLALAGDIKTVQSKLLKPGGDPNNPDDYYLISVQEEFITNISENVGDLNQLGGVPVYELDAEGNLLLDADGNPVVNEDPSIADRLLDVYGQWSIRIDNNGHVSGLGLRSNGTDENAFSEFIVNANVFAIGAPEDLNDPDSEAVQKRPFIVYQDGNGNNLIAMDTDVFIRNGTIKNAMIDNVIQSTNWQQWGPGINDFNGWKIDKDGDVYIDNLTAKGHIEADSIRTGSLEIIDTGMITNNAITQTELSKPEYEDGSPIVQWLSRDAEIQPPNQEQEGTLIDEMSIVWEGGRDNQPNAIIINSMLQVAGTTSSREGSFDLGLYFREETDDGRLGAHGFETVYHTYYPQRGYGFTATGVWHIVLRNPFADLLKIQLRAWITGDSSNSNNPKNVIHSTTSALVIKR